MKLLGNVFASTILVTCMLTSCAMLVPLLKGDGVYTGVKTVGEDLIERIDGYILERLPNYWYINVALVRNGEIVLTRSYGENRLEHTELYASVAKPLTATITLQLYEEGTIKSLDDPIGEYCEKYAGSEPAEYADTPVTFMHLLTHRSGFPHQSPLWSNGKLVIDFRPGTEMRYSTKGYGVLGEVLEAASGKTYRELVHDYIAAPVGADSLYTDGLFFEAPAGRVWSTISDMALFAIGVIEDTYISRELLNSILLSSFGADSEGEMGAGWRIANLGTDAVALYHGGSNGTPRAFLAVKPVIGNAVALTGKHIRSDGRRELPSLAIDLMKVLTSEP